MTRRTRDILIFATVLIIFAAGLLVAFVGPDETVVTKTVTVTGPTTTVVDQTLEVRTDTETVVVTETETVTDTIVVTGELPETR